MSSIINNIDNLLFESEIELDDKFIDIFEGKLKTAAKLGVAGTAAGVAGAYGKHVYDLASAPRIEKSFGGLKSTAIEKTTGEKLSSAVDVVKGDVGSATGKVASHFDKFNPDAPQYAIPRAYGKAKDFVADNPVAFGAAGAAIGAGLLYKYFTSITHYKRKLASLEAKERSASPEQKKKIQTAVNTIKQKLNNAQAKARMEHSSFIEKSRQMKAKVSELNKAGNKAAAAKLQQKLDKRQKFLSKIGASI